MLGSNIAQLQTLMDKLEYHIKLYGLNINTQEETKIMIFSKQQKKESIYASSSALQGYCHSFHG